jgi:hypothetical protein
MVASATLPTADKRLIDLYLFGVDAGCGFFTSITAVVVFQRDGKVLRAIVELRQHRRSTASIGNCFNHVRDTVGAR